MPKNTGQTGFVDRLESAVEGVVDGLFRHGARGRVQPLEIARQLTREAEEGKIISLSRVYVPNQFVIGLHPEDFQVLEHFAPELEAEFERYVGEWIADREYTVSGPVKVELRARESTARGRFHVTPTWSHMVARDLDEATGVCAESDLQPAVASLEILEGPDAGREVALFAQRMVLGRAADCDIQLVDSLASRHHAALEPWKEGWVVQDLDSTNGTRVNNERIADRTLQDGDLLRIGATVFRIRFAPPHAGDADLEELPAAVEPEDAGFLNASVPVVPPGMPELNGAEEQDETRIIQVGR